jgi:hypothetical protein
VRVRRVGPVVTIIPIARSAQPRRAAGRFPFPTPIPWELLNYTTRIGIVKPNPLRFSDSFDAQPQHSRIIIITGPSARHQHNPHNRYKWPERASPQDNPHNHQRTAGRPTPHNRATNGNRATRTIVITGLSARLVIFVGTGRMLKIFGNPRAC